MGDVFFDKTLVTNSWADSFNYTIVGLDFLQHYDLLFDIRTLRNKRTKLYYKQHLDKENKRIAIKSIFDNFNEQFGLGLDTQEEGNWWVWGVTIPGFAHDELGLIPGMTIVGINGQRIIRMEKAQLYEALLNMKEGGNIELMIFNFDGTEQIIKRKQ